MALFRAEPFSWSYTVGSQTAQQERRLRMSPWPHLDAAGMGVCRVMEWRWLARPHTVRLL